MCRPCGHNIYDGFSFLLHFLLHFLLMVAVVKVGLTATIFFHVYPSSNKVGRDEGH